MNFNEIPVGDEQLAGCDECDETVSTNSKMQTRGEIIAEAVFSLSVKSTGLYHICEKSFGKDGMAAFDKNVGDREISDEIATEVMQAKVVLAIAAEAREALPPTYSELVDEVKAGRKPKRI
jgi:hypothetical protein